MFIETEYQGIRKAKQNIVCTVTPLILKLVLLDMLDYKSHGSQMLVRNHGIRSPTPQVKDGCVNSFSLGEVSQIMINTVFNEHLLFPISNILSILLYLYLHLPKHTQDKGTI